MPSMIILNINFLLFIFFSSSLESFSNCMDREDIISDFRSTFPRSLILSVILLILLFIIPSSSLTLLFNFQNFESLALQILIIYPSFILIFQTDKSFDITSFPLENIVVAKDILAASFDRRMRCPALISKQVPDPLYTFRYHTPFEVFSYSILLDDRDINLSICYLSSQSRNDFWEGLAYQVIGVFLSFAMA